MVTTSPVIESPQGYWNITGGDKPDLPENVTSKIFSGKLMIGLVTHIFASMAVVVSL